MNYKCISRWQLALNESRDISAFNERVKSSHETARFTACGLRCSFPVACCSSGRACIRRSSGFDHYRCAHSVSGSASIFVPRGNTLIFVRSHHRDQLDVPDHGQAPMAARDGEFHYSRAPEDEWEEELLKMKSAGVQIISTYVIWIHHEEIEGEFDWSGRKDLKRFVELCGKHGLYVIVRIGCGPMEKSGMADFLTGC